MSQRSPRVDTEIGDKFNPESRKIPDRQKKLDAWLHNPQLQTITLDSKHPWQRTIDLAKFTISPSLEPTRCNSCTMTDPCSKWRRFSWQQHRGHNHAMRINRTRRTHPAKHEYEPKWKIPSKKSTGHNHRRRKESAMRMCICLLLMLFSAHFHAACGRRGIRAGRHIRLRRVLRFRRESFQARKPMEAAWRRFSQSNKWGSPKTRKPASWSQRRQSHPAMCFGRTEPMPLCSSLPSRPSWPPKPWWGVLFLLEHDHGHWKIADHVRFIAAGKYAEITAGLDAFSGAHGHIGDEDMLPVVTIKESQGGRGYSYNLSGSYTFASAKIKQLELK